MTRLTKFVATTGLMLAAAAAMPAQAQVAGNIATADIPRTVIGTTAFQAAWKQVEESYKQQIDLIRTRAQERQTLLAKYDKNGDKQVDDAEQATLKKSPDGTKLTSLETEIQQLSEQIDAGRAYAVEQILLKYSESLDEVVKAKQIKVVVEPSSLLYAVPETDITPQITAALNTRVASVGVVPPANWRPSDAVVQVFQQITQRLLTAQYLQAQQQAAAAQQQPPANPAAPAGR
ncbi:OmpH family outer membrane protein [Erythrobacter sp. NE805]|uniref:OmpH family outer membrane protein n=1 Tax=Erythrobacter sp. NE805 TaxID=3389875 RepID=UPI00396B48A7